MVLPGITHWQSPNFFAYFPGNASGPAILGDLISSGIGAQGMLWSTSPACTELETHVLDWLADMLGLPEQFKSTSAGGGVVQDTASSAVLCAVIAARERATNGSSNATGVDRTFTAYTSSQAHSSIVKAVGAAGVGRDNLRLIDVDDSYAMRPDALERAIASDLEQEHTPFLVCATVGTTSSTAIDPLRSVGQVARQHGLWFHVDAALAGTMPTSYALYEPVKISLRFYLFIDPYPVTSITIPAALEFGRLTLRLICQIKIVIQHVDKDIFISFQVCRPEQVSMIVLCDVNPFPGKFL